MLSSTNFGSVVITLVHDIQVTDIHRRTKDHETRQSNDRYPPSLHGTPRRALHSRHPSRQHFQLKRLQILLAHEPRLDGDHRLRCKLFYRSLGDYTSTVVAYSEKRRTLPLVCSSILAVESETGECHYFSRVQAPNMFGG